MVTNVDQQRVCALLTEAVTVICKNGLTFNSKFCIEGLLGITLDDRNMFLVNIKESIMKGGHPSQNQSKSQSMSKAGIFVGMPGQQSNGGRGPGQQSNGGRGPGQPAMGPRPGMSPMQQKPMQPQQMQQRRRPGGPPPQVIPPKRPGGVMGAPPGNMGRGQGPQPGIPQEWAALIQLQNQHGPPGMLPQAGRSRGTARRGGFNRMQTRMPLLSGQQVKSPPRRMSQSGVELESRKDIERKAAEQARSRSERLQRRKGLSPGGPTTAVEDTAAKVVEIVDDADSTPVKKRRESNTMPPPNTEAQTEDQQPESAASSSSTSTSNKADPETSPNVSTDEQNQQDDTKECTESTPDPDPTEPEQRQLTPDDNTTPTPDDATTEQTRDDKQTSEGKVEPTEGAHGGGGGGSGGGGEGSTKPEGDGSWLLSNSSWLLGDLESMASNTSWKDSAQGGQQPTTSKDESDDP